MNKKCLLLFLVIISTQQPWSALAMPTQKTSDQTDHQLAPCPASPNCVSSLATDDTHKVDAFMLTKPTGKLWSELKTIVSGIPRSKLVDEKPGYLHFEVRSLIFRFVDHLELAAEPESQRVEVRSASVIGYSDLGANRKRIETLRARLKEADLLR